MSQLVRRGGWAAALLTVGPLVARAQQMPVNLPSTSSLVQQAQQVMRNQPPPGGHPVFTGGYSPGVPGSNVTYIPVDRNLRRVIGNDELPPTRPGRYELTNGPQAEGQLVVVNDQLLVAQARRPLVFRLSEVRRVCFGPDTLLNLGAFADAGLRTTVTEALAQRFYHRAGYELYCYPLGLPLALISQARYVLRRPDGRLLVVPDSKGRLAQTLLPLLGECPAVAQRLQQGDTRSEQVPELLDQYLSWQQARP